MKNSPFFSLLIVAVVAGGILGGAFVGGVAMGKTQGSTDTASVAATPRPTTQSSQSNASGSQASQQPQSTQSSTQQQARQQFGQGGQGAGGTTVGTVSKVDGNVVTLTTAQGTTVNVQLSPDTTIEKTVTGSALPRIQANKYLKEVVITDSIPLKNPAKNPKIKVLTVALLLAEAIKRIHSEESVSSLFRDTQLK